MLCRVLEKIMQNVFFSTSKYPFVKKKNIYIYVNFKDIFWKLYFTFLNTFRNIFENRFQRFFSLKIC